MIEVLVNNDSSVLIRVVQDIGMENAPLFVEDISKIDQIESKVVFLDFSKVHFVDSSGIGALIKFSKSLKEKKSRLKLVGLNRSLHSVFKLAGLVQIFQIIEPADLKDYFSESELSGLF